MEKPKVMTRPTVRLLDDDPADNSAFDAHKNIADAIFDITTTEQKGRTIGLFGNLGSGKSTVINLIRQTVEKHNVEVKRAKGERIELFVFDAWLHGTDPLRRSFIEKLIEFYSSEKDQDDYYQKIKDEISRRREDSKITTTPKIKPFGISLFLVYCLSVSYASFLMDGFKSSDAGFQMSDWVVWIGMHTWPALLLISTRTREYISSVLFNENTREVEHSTIKTPDPTAIEFQDYFGGILLREQKRNPHKLIIVLDNLDRVSDEEAVKMLATMRSFFADNRKNNIWVFLPLDFDALARIFSQSDKPDIGRAKEFVEKTCGVNFRVPPPIVTDNKKYFMEQIEEAIPNWLSADNKQAIFDLYMKDGYGYGRSTPRKIKSYINDIGALLRIWHSKIDVKTLALYCLKVDAIRSDIRLFMSQTSGIDGAISREQVYIIDNHNWVRDLAALHFGVEPEKALHVFAGDDLHNGLEQGKEDENFVSIAKVHGFAEILREQMLNHRHSYCSSGTILAKAAYALAKLEENCGEDVEFAWKILADHMHEIERWEEFDEKTMQGFNIFLNKTVKFEPKYEVLIQQLFALPEHLFKNETTSRYWVDVVSELNEFVREVEYEVVLMRYANEAKEYYNDFFLSALSFAALNKVHNLSGFFKTLFGKNTLNEKLIDLTVNPADLSNLKNICEYLLSDGYSQQEYPSIVRGLADIVREQNYSHDNVTAIHLLGLLGSQNKSGNAMARKTAQGICKDGNLYGHLRYLNNKASNYKGVGECVAFAFEYDLSPKQPFSFQENAKFVQGVDVREALLKGDNIEGSQQIFDAFLEAMKLFTGVEGFIEKVVARSDYKAFAAKCVQQALRLSEVDTAHAVEHFGSYAELLPEDSVKRFIVELGEKEDFLTQLFAKGQFDGEPYALFDYFLVNKTPISQTLLEKVQKEFNEISSEQWTEALKSWSAEGEPIVDILQILIDSEVHISLNESFGDALFEVLDELIEVLATDEHAKFIGSLPNCLSEFERRRFIDKICNKVVGCEKAGEYDSLDKLVKTFGDVLDKDAFHSYGDTFVKGVLISAIGKPLKHVLQWAIRHAKELSVFLTEEYKEEVEIARRLSTAIRNAPEDDKGLQKCFLEFAECFDINVAVAEAEAEAQAQAEDEIASGAENAQIADG